MTVPGVVINNANAMSDLVRANCCRAIAVSVHMSQISQSIPPFYAEGYTASESVPDSTGSVSTSPDSESEVVGPVQKQRGQHPPDLYTMSKNQMTKNLSGKPGQHPWRNQAVQHHPSPSHGQLGQPECPYLLVPISAEIKSESMSESHDSFDIVSNGLVPGVSTGRAGPEQDMPGQVETISVQSISAVSKSVYAGRGSSGPVFDDPFAVLTLVHVRRVTHLSVSSEPA